METSKAAACEFCAKLFLFMVLYLPVFPHFPFEKLLAQSRFALSAKWPRRLLLRIIKRRSMRLFVAQITVPLYRNIVGLLSDSMLELCGFKGNRMKKKNLSIVECLLKIIYLSLKSLEMEVGNGKRIKRQQLKYAWKFTSSLLFMSNLFGCLFY